MKKLWKQVGIIALSAALVFNMCAVGALAVDDNSELCSGDENCVAETHTDECPKLFSTGDAGIETIDTDSDESVDWSENPDISWFDKNNKQDTYTLTTAAQLAGLFSLMKERRNGEDFAGITIKLGNDIVLNDTTDDDWSDSATKLDSSGRKTFAGTFDGDGHSIIGLYSETGLFPKFNGTIKNLTIDTAVISCTESGIYVGAIVGETSPSAKIENCTVKNSTITANYNTLGGVVGSAGNTPVKNCTVTNCTISSGGGVGGVCGTGGVIESCSVSADCSISGGNWVGGIVGSMGKSVTDCTNAAPVSGTGSIGGIVGGHSGSGSVISGCTNTGTVTGTSSVGGIIGGTTAQTLEISDCTNSGNVTGTTAVGGIAGHLFVDITIKNCTSEGSVSGTNDVGGIVGQSDLSTGQPYVAGTPNSITDCIVSADITGETNVGGLVGSNGVVDDSEKEATTIANNILTPDASVSGSTNVGALIGDNQTETDTGTIKNNFWPEAAGSASGNGAGSSSDDTTDSTIKTTNSSYGADGTLKTPITAGEGDEETTVETIGDVLDKILTDTETPDALKATVKFDKNGHGSTPSPSTREVVIGTKITLPGIDNDSYWTFLNWTADGQTYNAGAEYTVTENVIFTANWRNDKPSSSGNSTPTYTVTTPSKVENGTVKVSPKSAGKGDAVTITVTPAKGYEVDEVIVTDKNGKEISVKDKGDGKFTFTMPAGKVTVEASFTKIAEQPRVTFTDVPASAYYADAVAWAVENGITGGTAATTFSPDAPCTRAQTVTFLWRAAGSPAPRSSVNPFTDVQPGTYYYDAVLWAVENGITTGTTATTFSPNATVTRGQTVTFLHRAAGTTVIGSDPFTDVADSAYYAGAVKWAVAEGITSGTSATTFSPNQVCTRAQIVTFLYRAEA